MLGKLIARVLIALAISCCAVAAQAVVIDLVSVGNLGNSADTTGYGDVDYSYQIGKYEVTAGQYAEFLNAVAVLSDTYGLYNTNMWSSAYGCKIQQSGSVGSYTYAVAEDYANRPVNFVSFWDAARFANWLHNGQGSGDTETGAYTLDGYVGADGRTITRNPEAKWFLPSEDEWYKAAYHKNDGVTENYWDYPTSTDAIPSNVLGDPTDPGNNATFYGPGYTTGTYLRTEVGEHENSDSPYGTFDQGGNVWEWNEAVVSVASRGLRGGAYEFGVDRLIASYRYSNSPATEAATIGFRVASIREPVPGDANNDGYVDELDARALAENWGESTNVTWEMGDFDKDGIIGPRDAAILAANWGFGQTAESATVPEPGGLILLAWLAGMALMPYRRRSPD